MVVAATSNIRIYTNTTDFDKILLKAILLNFITSIFIQTQKLNPPLPQKNPGILTVK